MDGWAFRISISQSASKKLKTFVSPIVLNKVKNINAQNHYGLSSLHLACEYCLSKVAQCLIEHGCRLDKKDGYSRTALHWACVNRGGFPNKGGTKNHQTRKNYQNRTIVSIVSKNLKKPVKSLFLQQAYLIREEVSEKTLRGLMRKKHISVKKKAWINI